jgi:diguanylate cyclase (GGDEF)-like protein
MNAPSSIDVRQASGTVRRSVARSVRGTRVWVNANAYRAIAGLLVVPALMLLPLAERRWVMVALAALLVAFNAALSRLVDKRGGWTPWLGYVGFVAIVSAMAGQPDLFPACLVLLTANVAFVAGSYGRGYAVGLLALTAPLVAGIALWKHVPDSEGIVPMWLFAAFSTIAVIGESNDARRRLSRQYAGLIDGLGLVVWQGDGAMAVTVNEQVAGLFGVDPSDVRTMDALRAPIHPDDRHVLEFHDEQVRAGNDHELKYRFSTSDESVRWAMELVRVDTDPETAPSARVQGVIIDVTDRMRAEEQAATYANLVESVGLGMLIVDLPDPADDGSLRVVAANPAAVSLLGLPAGSAAGRRVASIFADVLDGITLALLAEVVRCADSVEVGPFRVQSNGASARYARLRAFPLPNGTAALTLEDATAAHMAAAALSFQANHDALTGLPNRAAFRHLLDQLIDESDAPSESMAIGLIDLERFREVNVALGHPVGDRVLVEIARRLNANGGGAELLARVGGDEFAFAVTGRSARAAADRLADVLMTALAEPIDIDGLQVPLSSAVGIATFPADGATSGELLDNVESALGTAKKTPERVAHFERSEDRPASRRRALLTELHTAIDCGDLAAHYQPIIDLATGAIVGAEALVRWQHAEHGLVPPGEFIELAESSGVLTPLTQFMASHAISDLVRWRTQGLEVAVTLNVSPRCLYDPGLIGAVLSMLDEGELDPSSIQFEITERALSDDPIIAREALQFLRDRGCSISIDDFGAGYSSLSHLRQLPVDEIKIAPTFVRDIEHGDDTLVGVIIDLGHALGARVSAENVESKSVLDRLAALGCDRAQGFLFSPAVTGESFVDLALRPASDLAGKLDAVAAHRRRGAVNGTVTHLPIHRRRK